MEELIEKKFSVRFVPFSILSLPRLERTSGIMQKLQLRVCNESMRLAWDSSQP
jgi:hypothetical protein